MEQIKVNSAKAWFLAARPKTLTGAMIPTLLAGALAFRVGAFDQEDLKDGAVAFGTPALHVVLWICCLLFACLMQIVANFINDIYDFQKGTDREDRLGPERACAQGWITPSAMKKGIVVTIIIACLTGLVAVALSYQYLPMKGVEFIILGISCVIFAFLYTTRLSYLGWGDLLVLIFFGFVPVCGTYYLQTLNISTNAILLSLISGIAIDALLMINNYRDREQDRISGKRTIVVRFGEKCGRYAYLTIGIIVTVLVFVVYNLAIMPDRNPLGYIFLALQLVYPFLHVKTWRNMVEIFQGKALNRILGETSRNMFLMSVLLSLALLFG